MNPGPEDAPPARNRLVPRLVWIVLGVLLVGVGGLFAKLRFSPHGKHVHLISRIQPHVKGVMRSVHMMTSPATELTGEDRTRGEAMIAIDVALGNALWDYAKCDDIHLTAIADRLDRTNAEELKTGTGCLRLVEELIEVCPTAKDYWWFEHLRELQAQGFIPKLPSKK